MNSGIKCRYLVQFYGYNSSWISWVVAPRTLRGWRNLRDLPLIPEKADTVDIEIKRCRSAPTGPKGPGNHRLYWSTPLDLNVLGFCLKNYYCLNIKVIFVVVCENNKTIMILFRYWGYARYLLWTRWTTSPQRSTPAVALVVETL